MTVYTSRYGNPELQTGEYYVIGITLGKPKFSLGYEENGHCYMLAPDKSMWGKSHEEFSRLYKKKLDGIGRDRIRNVLNGIMRSGNGKDVVLVCYEDVRKEGEFCHRIDFAEWVAENLSFDIIELKDSSEVRGNKKAPGQKQLTLF